MTCDRGGIQAAAVTASPARRRGALRAPPARSGLAPQSRQRRAPPARSQHVGRHRDGRPAFTGQAAPLTRWFRR